MDSFTAFKRHSKVTEVRESDIENYLVREVKKRKGIPYKFTSPGRRSVPDRLILLPDGVLFFIEVKRPGGSPTIKQLQEHARLRDLGQVVFVVDSKAEIDGILEGFCD
jgi:hypothetical protein